MPSLKDLACPCFLVEEPLRLVGRRRLEFGGLVKKFGNVLPPTPPPTLPSRALPSVYLG